MNILALETSTRLAQLAATRDYSVLAEVCLPDDRRTTESLAPALHRLLEDVSWKKDAIGLIAVSQGPGSFTGLRIGVTTAKTLAYACQVPLVAVDTLRVVAQQVASPTPGTPICPLLDAHRRQAFAALYERRSSGALACVRASHVVAVEQLLRDLPPETILTGPLVGQLDARFLGSHPLAEPDAWHPRAATVARLALDDYLAGLRHDLWTLTPNYLRPSAAEEKASR